jgi:hypothetical protein
MRGSIGKFAATLAAAGLCAGVAAAQQNGPNPACRTLEAQLTSLERGNADPGRAAQIRQAEDAVNRQQFNVDKLVEQSRRMGCQSSGFFSIFSNPPAQCGSLTRRIGQERSELEHLQNGLERLNGGTTERAAQRQSLLIALGDNNCGPQYRSAAIEGQRNGFFDRLFGGNGDGGNGAGNITTTPNGPMGGTYRTICVRTCDGYYFPISFSTTPDHFGADEQACQRMCPAAEVQLYTYHNPGEDVSQAVSLAGQPYTALPTAFQYRKALNQACSCRRAGESWYEALRGGGGPDQSAGPAQQQQQAQQPNAKAKAGAKGGSEPALGEAPGRPDPTKRSVRTVGPTFLPAETGKK